MSDERNCGSSTPRTGTFTVTMGLLLTFVTFLQVVCPLHWRLALPIARGWRQLRQYVTSQVETARIATRQLARQLVG